MADVITLGWRERAALPGLRINRIKAKLDTGARSCALHVEALESFARGGQTWVRFTVGPGRRHGQAVACEAPASDQRVVIDTGGQRSLRWFIRSELALAGEVFTVDIGLADRRHMLFPLLLGRTALHGRFAVDPALSYTRPAILRAATETS